MKRLSVIIPGYNNGNALWERCIKSVLAACGTDDEVICVDDGSSAKPEVKINDCRVRWLFLGRNFGQAVARNRALDIAQGRYVTFVDSDDAVKPDVYRLAIEKLEATSADVCLFGVECVWPKERLVKHDVPESCGACMPTGELVERWYKGCVLNYISNKVIRKAFIDDHDLRIDSEGMPCEDVMFFLETLIAGAKWCAIDYEGYVYYRTADTSLAHYKACHHKGTMACAETWARFCKTRVDGGQFCGYHAHVSPRDMALSDWDNIWREESPYALRDKYQWFVANAAVMGLKCIWSFFVKQMVKSFVRKHLYFMPIRKRHYKSIYPTIMDA